MIMIVIQLQQSVSRSLCKASFSWKAWGYGIVNNVILRQYAAFDVDCCLRHITYLFQMAAWGSVHTKLVIRAAISKNCRVKDTSIV